jgi:hypothetical protein
MGQGDEAEMGCGSGSLIHLLFVRHREAAPQLPAAP